jgi:hypothetical protein
MTGVVDLCHHLDGVSVARMESFEPAPNVIVETVTIVDSFKRCIRVHSTNRRVAIATDDGRLEETDGNILSVLRTWMRLGQMHKLLKCHGV